MKSKKIKLLLRSWKCVIPDILYCLSKKDTKILALVILVVIINICPSIHTNPPTKNTFRYIIISNNSHKSPFRTTP